jgi:hypothetical protein
MQGGSAKQVLTLIPAFAGEGGEPGRKRRALCRFEFDMYYNVWNGAGLAQ